MLDPLVNVDKKYYPQVFLNKWNYAEKKRKEISTIKEELKLDESDSELDIEFDKH